MLYSMYEAQRAFMAPMRYLTQTSKALNGHPLGPFSYTAFGRALEAGMEVLDGVIKDRGKPDWEIDEAITPDGPLPVSFDPVIETPFCDLVHVNRTTKRKDPKVLLVAPVSGHYATLLRGTVRGLIQEHDVYVTDWKDARTVPMSQGFFHLDDYIDLLMTFMRHLGPDLHVVAVCQPAPITLATVALMADMDDPAQPASMTLMGGPIDPHAAPTVVTQLADARPMSWFETRCITRVPVFYPGAFRRVYPGFMQVGAFIAMNPDRHFSAHLAMFRHLVEGDGEEAEAKQRFYDEYLSVMDVPAEYYLETVERVFKERQLPRGIMEWRGQLVRPAAIKKTAMLTVEGEKDDISAPGQTLAAHDLTVNIPEDRRRNHLAMGVGHYGIFNGRKWRENILPEITKFIREVS
ncbi:MAG: polyhydroxyalkanoate depolymerase [Thalassobaculum sp.]